MAKKKPTDSDPHDPASLQPKDKKAERAVLAFLIYRYPALLTIPGLSQELNEDASDLDREDTVERAVRELVGVGLLECRGAFVVPTRVALYFERLETD
jgi:hypothetical protein